MRVVVVSSERPGPRPGPTPSIAGGISLARLLIRSGEITPGGLAAARRAGPSETQPANTGPAATGGKAYPAATGGQAYRAARRSAGRWALLVAAGWLLQAGLRAWFSRGQSVPLANPDESAYLIAARVLAGGPAADFSYSTLYQGGYPLLIMPVYWFTSDPGTVYHAVLLVNAALS